jgi:hypothetical protein
MMNFRSSSLREIELAAHRARNREMARLASGLGPKRIHHA